MDRLAPEVRRTRVIFRGHVQGVGFRYTTCEVARGYAVSGFVRNLADGSVELEGQGAADELDRFLAALRTRMAGNIRSETAASIAVVPQDHGFDIRR